MKCNPGGNNSSEGRKPDPGDGPSRQQLSRVVRQGESFEFDLSRVARNISRPRDT